MLRITALLALMATPASGFTAPAFVNTMQSTVGPAHMSAVAEDAPAAALAEGEFSSIR